MIRWSTACLAAVALLMPAARAWAGSCSGSSGGSSSSSSSGGSSSSSWDSSSDSYSSDSSDSSSSSAPSCTQYSAAVGYAECTRFGTWNRSKWPALKLSAAFKGGVRSLDGMRFDSSVEHERYHRLVYHGTSPRTGESASQTFGMLELGLAGFISRHLYLGGRFAFGGGAVQSPDPMPSLRPSSILNLEAGAVFGAALPLGNWQLRSDLTVGWNATVISLISQQGDCIETASASRHGFLAEPRLALDRWLSPWTTIGAFVATDASRPGGDLRFGISITGHTRSFDRQR